MHRIGFIIVSVLIVLALASSMVFVVDQRQFGVLYALGQIKDVITQPGLHFKLPPPFQNVSYVDKRLLTLESRDVEPMLTAEKQRVVIDWFVRWRITDPGAYIRNVGLDEGAGATQLNRVLRNAFQEEINKHTVRDIISTEREELMTDVKRKVLEVVRGEKPWGVDIIDVRLTRADYVEAITESVYRRMEAERKRVANELRSTGAAEGEKIRAEADRQREVMIANAYRDAQKIKGEGDGTAAGVYADAFGRDPQFAQFYRSLDAYRGSFNKRSDVMVLDPSSDFFRAMQGATGFGNGDGSNGGNSNRSSGSGGQAAPGAQAPGAASQPSAQRQSVSPRPAEPLAAARQALQAAQRMEPQPQSQPMQTQQAAPPQAPPGSQPADMVVGPAGAMPQ